MEFCPEIAILHGTFTLVEAENQSGKNDHLLQHRKGFRSSRTFQLIKGVIEEIVQGPEMARGPLDQKLWNRRMHHIFFCKSFVYNGSFTPRDVEEEEQSEAVKCWKMLCLHIPDLHPHLYFELFDELGWAEFLREFLPGLDLPTALHFTSCCLEFCSPEPALVCDLHLVSGVLDYMASACFVQLTEQSFYQRHVLAANKMEDKVSLTAENDMSTSKKEINKNVSFDKTSEKSVLHEKIKTTDKAVVKEKMLQAGSSEKNNETVGDVETDRAVSSAEIGKKVVSEERKGHEDGLFEDRAVCGEAHGEAAVEEKATESVVSTAMEKVLPCAIHAEDEAASNETAQQPLLDRETVDTGTAVLDQKTERRVNKISDRVMVEELISQLDQKILDTLFKWMDLTSGFLGLVQKRMCTKLFDRKSCPKSSAMSEILFVLGHIVASVILFSLLSVSKYDISSLRDFMQDLLVVDGDDHSEPGNGKLNARETNQSKVSDPGAVENPVSEILCVLARTAQMRAASVQCLSSFFSTGTTKGGTPHRLSADKSVKFGRVLKLRLGFSNLSRPVDAVKLVQRLSDLLSGEGGDRMGGPTCELEPCVAALLNEVQRREKLAEHRRLNPPLTEVVDRIEKRRHRWKWCIQYGLAKKDLKDWWFAGFLAVLHQDPSVLESESDVLQLLSLMSDICRCSGYRDKSLYQDMCAKVICKAFSLLPRESMENVILAKYKTSNLSSLPLVENFDQSLTITFNKFSASTSIEALLASLRLCLHDALAFTRHAVTVASTNRGQIPVVVRVLQQVAAVMGAAHPLHHPSTSLLGHCLHSLLLSHCLSPGEQRNTVQLLSLMLQTPKSDKEQSPLLSPSEFLTNSVLPFIELQSPDPKVGLGFALKALIGCLEATLCVKRSDWLEDVPHAVVIACCGGILQQCEVMLAGGEEVDWWLGIKESVLRALDLLHSHCTDRDSKCEERTLAWLQEKCVPYGWRVCAYLGRFLMPANDAKQNKMMAEFSQAAVSTAWVDPQRLLLLCACSDEAASHVMQELHRCQVLSVAEDVLLSALGQVLPRLLVSEVSRVVHVLMELVQDAAVHVGLRCPQLDKAEPAGCAGEMAVTQLLTEAVLLVLSPWSSFVASHSRMHHVTQVLVTALKAVQQLGKESAATAFLDRHTFMCTCVLMSAACEVMLDPLFVVLLDLLTGTGESKGLDASDSLLQAISLIPVESLQLTLTKKLKKLDCQ